MQQPTNRYNTQQLTLTGELFYKDRGDFDLMNDDDFKYLDEFYIFVGDSEGGEMRRLKNRYQRIEHCQDFWVEEVVVNLFLY